MPNEFIVKNGLISQNNLIVSGSITATGGLTVSGSSAATVGNNTFSGSQVISGSLSLSGSGTPFSLNADVLEVTGSLLVTGSASITGSLTATGTITAQTLVVQTITSSVDFVTGSTRFGSLAANTHTFTGSLLTSGSIGIGTPTPSAPLEISYNNTSYTTTPILSLNNTNINGQTHINFLITGSLVGKIRSDYEGGMIYATNNRGADRAHYFLVNGDVNTGSVVLAIKANNRVGIGTQLPSSTLGISAAGADGLIMEPDTTSANNSSRLFFTGSVQTFALFNNAGDLRLTHTAQAGNTSGTSFVRFTNTGKYLRMEGSTGGVQFGGDTAAANALNDYEEGTWTPVIAASSGGATYGSQLGFYTKIGRVVTITWFLSFTKSSLSGGTVRLTNFPFTLIGGTFYPQGTVLFDNLSTVTNNITLQGANSSTGADFIGGNGGTTDHAGLPIAVLGTGTMNCRGTLTYFTA